MGELPYVISSELEFVNDELVRSGAIDDFRASLDADLQAMGKQTLWVDAYNMRSGMKDLLAQTNLPVVTLDNRYVQDADASLGISRAITADLDDAGYDARLGCADLQSQFDALGRRFGGQEVVLADDVLFSGGMIAGVRDELARRNIRVPALVSGIAIGEGSDRLAALGVETQSVLSFSDVEDELCERDFTLLPGSGRKVMGEQQSALYFEDRFGRPEQWASIPSGFASQFCLGSLARNCILLQPQVPMPNFVGYPAGPVGAILASALAARG